jgi:hypothetical protein
MDKERSSFVKTSDSTFKLSFGRQSKTTTKLLLVIGTLVMLVAVPVLNLHSSVLTTLNLQTSSTQEENDGILESATNNVDVALAASKNESNKIKLTKTSSNQKAASKPQSIASVNKAWCPAASCSNSALCQPCRQRFLFILATGRSASTTLLDMINHLPNVRLAGENNNELYIASLLEKNLPIQGFANLRSKVPARPAGAWFRHSIPEQSMACAIQKVLHVINPPPEEVQQQIISNESSGITLDGYEMSQIVGAKMIRIQNGDWEPLEAAEFFKYNFPCAKYIVNTRLNFDSQAASVKDTFASVSTSTLEQVLDKCKRDNAFLTKFAQHMGEDKARLIYMEDWVNNVTHLNEVVEWLGFRNCRYGKVLHNNANGYKQDKSILEVGGGCQAPIGS